MNKEDIIRMAREVGLPYWYETKDVVNEELLIKFATLIASAEREACAKDLDDASEAAKDVDQQGFVWRAVKECATAIRKREQA